MSLSIENSRKKFFTESKKFLYSANILFLPSYLILEITKFILSSTGVKDLDNEVSSVPNVESGPIDEEKLREIVNESVDYYLGKLIIP